MIKNKSRIKQIFASEFIIGFSFTLLCVIWSVEGEAGACWWSGCQPLGWATRGCPTAGYDTKESKKCEGGDMYHCCPEDIPTPSPPKNGCWWSGCQPFNWAERGCAEGFEEIENSPCKGGTIYQCCPAENETMISEEEFNKAAATKRGYPDASFYEGFMKSIPQANITSKEELAKYLAHTCWETVGFQFTKEVLCQDNLDACKKAYPNRKGGLPDKVYYGRGMMQLTWDYNYKAASNALYRDDRLIENPDVVGDDPEIGWATAAWYWAENVHEHAKTFGSTLFKINGALECDGGPNAENRIKRFTHYKQILRILKMPTPPDSDGHCRARKRRPGATRKTTVAPVMCKTEM